MFGVLYLQSSYSMLNNAIPLPSLFEEVKQGGYDFIALSDNNLHGMLSLFNLAKKHNIKPIIGLKIKVSIDLMYTSFLVYVKNKEGYQNLLKLSLLSNEQSLAIDDLKTYQKGLIFVTSGPDSIVNHFIMNEDYSQAGHYIDIFKSSFNDFYLGLSLDTFQLEMKVAPILLDLSEKTKIKLLPIHQTSYLKPEGKEVYEALIKIEDEKNEVLPDANYQFLNKDELSNMFMDYSYVFDSLSTVIQAIDFEWVKPNFEMPKYPVENGTPYEYLKSLSIVGLKKRLKKIPNADVKVYQKRLTYELSVIHKMGFDNYFLIVYDFVKYAKTHDILVGPGRGSSAGSLVAYCLGITDVDPITYDLLFERFLNPERITMPDIDMDFPDNKRDEVLQYVKEKYGNKHIISIVTFGTFALRSSIRDIARVMKIDPSRVTGIIQSVINDKADQTDEEMTRLLRVAKTIEGLPRHTGTHAAGMILADQDLTNYIPLQKGLYDFYQSQLEASDLESLGLLKVDFLGIRNLAVIDDAIKMIHRLGEPFSLVDIPLDNEKTYELLSRAETSGVFQLESGGMRAVLRKLKPRDFEDIVAILALFRPGPMDNIDEYIERRNGKKYEYVHPNLEAILKKTYGIIVYQEQIMRIANEFAGYTLAEADLLRRGISKKDKNILEDERKRFILKCKDKNYTQETAEEIYDYIVKFADYGFNRSHSVAYALVAYQMAYLKANYFPVFMTILLSSVTGNEGLTQDYLNELKKHQVKILPPDINLSSDQYIYKNNVIYMPLLAVKSIGRLTVQKIMEERNTNGEFKDYQDFKLRMKKDLNDKNLEMLIHSGALDAFGLNHQTMNYHKQIDDAGYEQYITDFKLKTTEDYSFFEKAQFEKEALGFNLMYNPINAHQDLIAKLKLKPLSDLYNQHEILTLAYIKNIKVIKTKQGKEMAFALLDDGSTELEATLFTDTYLKYIDLLNREVRIFRIKANVYKDKKSNVIEEVKKID
ncbi:MAG: DNA polymerase III subunit alpha [Tenericutes bacterium HGW-Tenericutes-2]|nr:MAG: DNA polymerase III subunit alpha [Tenericutes bacterium HGW-Tenericutes-2]